MLTSSLIAALLTGGLAAAISLLTAVGWVDRRTHADSYAALLILTALVFLILAAHSIDRIGDISKARKLNDHGEELFAKVANEGVRDVAEGREAGEKMYAHQADVNRQGDGKAVPGESLVAPTR